MWVWTSLTSLNYTVSPWSTVAWVPLWPVPGVRWPTPLYTFSALAARGAAPPGVGSGRVRRRAGSGRVTAGIVGYGYAASGVGAHDIPHHDR